MAHTVQQALNNVYLRSTGKATTLDIASSKGQRILSLLNFFQEDWASDPVVDWRSLRRIYTLPTVVSTTDTYSLSGLTDLNHYSRQEGDFIRVFHTNGTDESVYTIVDPARLYNDGRQTPPNSGPMVANAKGTVTLSGPNLVFDTPFISSSPQIGGTIKVPYYATPAQLVYATDVIACDDAEWLETRCAAEYCRNDITRVQLYPSLLDEANDKLNTLRMENDAQVDTVYTGGWSLLGVTWS